MYERRGSLLHQVPLLSLERGNLSFDFPGSQNLVRTLPNAKLLPSPQPPSSASRNLGSWVRPDGADNKPLVLTWSRKQSRSGASQVCCLPALLGRGVRAVAAAR